MSIDAGSIHSRLDIDCSDYFDGLDRADRQQQKFVSTVEKRYPKIKADASPFEQSVRHANKLIDDLEANISQANKSSLRIDSKAFVREIARAEEAVKVLELQMEETNNFELEVEIGKLKENVAKAKGAILEYDAQVEEAKSKVLSLDVSDMEKSMVSANRRIDAYMQNVDTASKSELNIRTQEYQNAMKLVSDNINDYQRRLSEVNQSDLTIDISPVQRQVAIAKSTIIEYQSKVKTASREQLDIEARKVFDAMDKARNEVAKYQEQVREAQNLKMTLDTGQISTSLAEVRTNLSTTQTAFRDTFNSAESDVARFTSSGKNSFNEFGGVTGRFATVLRMDVGDSVKTTAMKLATMEAEVRKNARQFGSYSEQVRASRKAMTDYALSLDDATFKTIYIDSKTQAHSASIQQQASQIKMNARMMKLMGDQTEITNRHLEALSRNGVTPEEFFATPKTIGQVERLNRAFKDGNNDLMNMSRHHRKIWEGIESNIKSWSINKMAIKQARQETAHLGDTQEANDARMARTNELIQLYTQQFAVWQTTVMGLIAGATKFYQKVFETAMENNAQLREEVELVKAKVLEAFEPMIKVASDFAMKVLEIVGAVADWISEFNEANPVLAEMLSILTLLMPAIAVLASPLMIAGNLINGMKIAINGLNAMLALLGTGFAITGASIASIILPTLAVVGAIASVIAIMRVNEETLFDLQDKYGDFGQGVSIVMEFVQGVCQMSIGNIMILLKTLGKMLLALVQGEWKTMGAIWKEGWQEMENNTAIAMSNMRAETSQAYVALKNMTREELGEIQTVFEKTMPAISKITADNVKEQASSWADAMADQSGTTVGMSDTVLSTVRGMSDTMAIVFEGIEEGMDIDDAKKKLEQNFKSVAMTGINDVESLERETTRCLELIEDSFETSGDNISRTGEEIFERFSKATNIGMDNALDYVSAGLDGMNQSTIDGLSGMGGTWKDAFDGITDISNMKQNEIKAVLEENLAGMNMTTEDLLSAMESEWKTYSEGLVDTTSASFDTVKTVTNDMLTSMEEKLAETSQNGSTSMETLATNLIGSVNEMGVSGEDMRSLGDTFKTVFDGIELNGSMSSKEVREKVTENLKGLNLTGSEILELFKTESDTTFEEIAQSAETNSKKTKEDWEKESELAKETGSKNFQDLSKNIDDSNKEATKSTETETKKQKKAIEENTADSNKTGSKNSKELNDNIQDDVTESAVVTAKEAKKINKAINDNLADSTRVTQKEMAQMNKSIQQNATNMYNGVNTSFTKMSQVCKQATSDMYNGINTSFTKMSQVCKQNATDLYKGVTTSFSKMATQVKQDATNMYNGAKTSFSSMESSAKQSASNMYNGVTTSTSRMANQAISDWNRVKEAYRASITANVYIKVHGLNEALNAINKVKNATRGAINMSVSAKSGESAEGYGDMLRDTMTAVSSYKSASNVIEFKITEDTKKDEKDKKKEKPIEMNVNFNIKEVNAQTEKDVHKFMEEVTDVLKREIKSYGGAY